MAKNIIVQDEYYRANHMSGVTRLRTELEEGGVCYWIPEDEAIELTEKTITENGTYTAVDDDANGYSSVTVAISNTYRQEDNGKVVVDGNLVDQFGLSVSANGTYDTTLNNEVTVDVENTYGESDEGKVVSGSSLVSQSSVTFSTNGIYDTTLNNEVTVETSSNLSTKTITVNGTYNASSDSVDGYSAVTVSVPNTYSYDDNGKVIYWGNLVSQSALTVVTDGEYDTTFNNRVIVDGAAAVIRELDITENRTYNASDYNCTGFSRVRVSVPSPSLGTVTFSDNGVYSASDYGFYGFSIVDVGLALSSATFSQNGTYEAESYGYRGFLGVTVDVQPNVTEYTFSENGTYSASDYGYDGFSMVSVDVQPNVNEFTFSENGTYSALDYGYDGFSTVIVDVSAESGGEGATSLITRTIDSVYDENVDRIGSYAFAECQNLTTVSFPNCSYIGRSAFYECTSLSAVYFLGTSAVVIDAEIFSPSAVPSIFVPNSMVNSYKQNGYWSIYSDYIAPYSE